MARPLDYSITKATVGPVNRALAARNAGRALQLFFLSQIQNYNGRIIVKVNKYDFQNEWKKIMFHFK